VAAWEKWLERWETDGLIPAESAARIRAFEAGKNAGEHLRWPVLLVLALGGLLLSGGVLLFVAAHWDTLSPGARFGLVLALVAVFPLASAFVSERFRPLAVTLYAVGTACAGAGIFLAAQLFNLQEHWPDGLLLWSLAALAAWWLVRSWPQAVLVALLTPAWLLGEWLQRTERSVVDPRLPIEAALLLAITYATARDPATPSVARTAVTGIGLVASIPATLVLVSTDNFPSGFGLAVAPASVMVSAVGWTVALGAPLALALILRGRRAWVNVLAAVWVLVLGTTCHHGPATRWQELGPYAWCALGALGMGALGVSERKREGIELGVVGFALTVLLFYFSNVMDKLGRATSLIGFGLIFLLGGWFLERVRRGLLARVRGAAR